MKNIYACLLAAPILIYTGMAQDANPAGAGRGRPARGEQRRQPPMERIMAGGDIEQNMMLRILESPQLAEQLKITAEQREAITASFKDFDAQIETMRPKLQESLVVQTALLGEAEIEDEKLMSAVEDTWKLRTEIAKLQTRKLLALRSELTPEQLAQATELMNQRMRRMESFRQRQGQQGPEMRRQRPGGGEDGQPRRGGEGRQRGGERRQRGQGQGAPFTPPTEP